MLRCFNVGYSKHLAMWPRLVSHRPLPHVTCGWDLTIIAYVTPLSLRLRSQPTFAVDALSDVLLVGIPIACSGVVRTKYETSLKKSTHLDSLIVITCVRVVHNNC
jgi:hypothetical protein